MNSFYLSVILVDWLFAPKVYRCCGTACRQGLYFVAYTRHDNAYFPSSDWESGSWAHNRL